MELSTYLTEFDLQNDIRRFDKLEEEEIQQRVWEYFFGEENGQCRSDVKWRYHDLIGISLGVEGQNDVLSFIASERLIDMTEIHLGKEELNRKYTIFDGSYCEFLADTLRNHLDDRCLFLPSRGLTRSTVYEGKLAAILTLVDRIWKDLYEFTITSPDLRWMADYNHHHFITVYGDQEAGRARMLCGERRKWLDRVLHCDFSPKTK